MNKINRKHKDSVFVDLFANDIYAKENFIKKKILSQICTFSKIFSHQLACFLHFSPIVYIGKFFSKIDSKKRLSGLAR